MAGCSCARNGLDTSLKYFESKVAYLHAAPNCLTHDQERHYERGFRCGYVHVAKGRKGCPPAVPPEQYWAHKYQSPSGRQYIGLWYDGYRAGAAAAKCNGLDAYHRVYAVSADCDCQSNCDSTSGPTLPPAHIVKANRLAMGAPAVESWGPAPTAGPTVAPAAPHAVEPGEPVAAPPADDSADADQPLKMPPHIGTPVEEIRVLPAINEEPVAAP